MKRTVATSEGAARVRGGMIAILATVLLVLTASSALAHKRTPPPEPPAMEETAEVPPGERDGSAITLTMVKEAELGDSIRLEARLASDEGDPIEGALVTFTSPAAWGEEVRGDMVLAIARTNHDGIAAISMVARRSGNLTVSAHFSGNAKFEPIAATVPLEVVGDRQLYGPRVGIDLPVAGAWSVGLVIAAAWALFLVAARRALAIARMQPGRVAPKAAGGVRRRDFLRGIAVPVGIQTAIVALGSGLVGLVARSPRTHVNLVRRVPSDYHRTPLAFVGQHTDMREMPEVLTREVSFSRDVMPILMARAGPHVMTPKNSPPPSGVRLDAYEHIINNKDLVVPGKPEESHLVRVLLDPAMQMPPGLPPLPESEVQIIASWVAQGANDN